MDKKQKEFWKQFRQSKNKDEETLKKLLFNGDLTKEEFEYIISCVIGPLFAPSLFYPALFKKCPQLMDQCNWTMLNHIEWRDLLMEYPQFADKCDKWELFDDIDWANLLRCQPQFSDRCNVWVNFSTFIWCYLLVEQPCFADKCNKWNEFSNSELTLLLKYQPLLADKCAWCKINGDDWVDLLKKQPQFANKCEKWNEFNRDDWNVLLSKQPQFADKCDKWNEFNEVDWSWLLSYHPQFTYRCDKLDDFNEEEWCDLLAEQPQLIEYCNTSVITEKGKAKLLAKHPDLVIYFPEKTETKVPEKDTPKKQIKNKLVALLLENENAEVSSEEFEKFTGSDWVQLLSEKPEFANKCDCYEVVGDIGINVMVKSWDKLTAKQWYDLLIKQPQFADKCNKWNDFPHWMLTSLLKKHSQLAKYFK